MIIGDCASHFNEENLNVCGPTGPCTFRSWNHATLRAEIFLRTKVFKLFCVIAK